MVDSPIQLVFGLVALVLVYKILDYLVRIPRLSSSPGKRRNVLATGCDTGFGNVFAKRMDKEGYQVFAACLTESGQKALGSQTSERVRPFLMDVSKVESVRSGLEFVTSCLQPSEGLWAVVNNAGVLGPVGPAEWLNREDYDPVFNVNFFGVVNVCTVFLPLLRKVRGRIVNTASIVGRIALPLSMPYTVSKYCVEGYSDSLRREIRNFGVSVHIVEPGFFLTNLTTNSEQDKLRIEKIYSRLSKDLKQTYQEGITDKILKTMDETVKMMSSTKLDLVVDAYEHAVTSVFPRGRYMPGLNGRLVLWPVSLLPEWLSDFLITLNASK